MLMDVDLRLLEVAQVAGFEHVRRNFGALSRDMDFTLGIVNFRTAILNCTLSIHHVPRRLSREELPDRRPSRR